MKSAKTLVILSLVFTLVGSARAALPQGWHSQDIGTTGGSASESDGTWTISGDGVAIWNRSDEFHYVCVPLSGDGTIVARVIDNGTGSNIWSKGGVMIRETLDGGSKHAMMLLTGGGGGGISFQFRQETSGLTSSSHGNPEASPPYWIKLTRVGSTITGYHSADGVTWEQQPNNGASNPVEIEMATDVYIGLFVSSNSGGELRTYTFDNVEVTSVLSELGPVNPGTDGLIASYVLDGDTNDSSGNEHNGTAVGDPVFVEGKVGMALDLDGTDDLIELGKFDVAGHITLAAWIKPDDFEINDARIITKANEWSGDNHWWMVSTISETSLRFRLKTDEGPTTATLVSDPVLETGVFTHVAATWDGSMMRLYKDGVEVASQEKGGTAVAVDPDISVAIGSQPSDAFASDPSHVVKFFDGLIDDIRIYDRALSEAELRYLAGERVTPVDPGTESLVAFYALDGDPNDSSGNGNDGTIGGTPNWIEGKIGSALEFDGSSTYIEIPFSESLKLINQGDFTLSTWFKADEIPPENKEVLQQGDGNGTGRTWLFVHNSNEIQSFLGGGTTASGIGVEAGIWTHGAVVITEGADADTIQLYVNGEPAGEPSQMDLEDCEGVYFIGRHKNPTNFWDGLIDELQLYNKALSNGEIRYLAGFRPTVEVDPSLVIYYSFDEVSDIVADQSGKGHDGVIMGAVTAEADGKIGGAANFANGGYLDLDGANFPTDDIPTSAMTLAAWIKIVNTGGDHEIFNARASDESWIMHPEPKSSGDIRWLLRSYGGTTIFQIRAGTITWDEWLHFAGTYDKESGIAALYINGELIEEMVVENPADIAGDWGMGARVGKTIDDARPFTGLIDEFRMYKRALSQDEIIEIMQGM